MLNHLLCHGSIYLKERRSRYFEIVVQHMDNDVVMPCNDNRVLIIDMGYRNPGFNFKFGRFRRVGFKHHQKIIFYACAEGNALDIGLRLKFKLWPEFVDGYFRHMTFSNRNDTIRIGFLKSQFSISIQGKLHVITIIPRIGTRHHRLDWWILNLADALELIDQDLSLCDQLFFVWHVLVMTSATFTAMLALW